MYYSFIIHSSVNGHLGCFCFVVNGNQAAMNKSVHLRLEQDISSSGYMPWGWYRWTYGSSIFIFLKLFPEWLYQLFTVLIMVSLCELHRHCTQETVAATVTLLSVVKTRPTIHTYTRSIPERTLTQSSA